MDKEIISYLFKMQPPIIRRQLLESEYFIEKMELTVSNTVNLLGVVKVDQIELFQAIRKSFISQKPETFKDLNEEFLFIKIDENSIKILSSEKSRHKIDASMNELFALSPNKDQRTKALFDILKAIGPMAPDYSYLMDKAEVGELSNEDLSTLLNELSNGVLATRRKIIDSIQNKDDPVIEDIIPKSPKYYEYFCGPDPGQSSKENYINNILPEYRKNLLTKDLPFGLDVCLTGFLHPNLSPRLWISSVSDEKLLSSIQFQILNRDVYSLLAFLDLALDRQNNEKFKKIAIDIVELLSQEKLNNQGGVDQYELLPILADSILNRINCLDGFATKPPYWKRMCAWMHAAFLINVFYPYEIKLDELKAWSDHNKIPAGNYASILDLRIEPMYSSMDMSDRSLRLETYYAISKIRYRIQNSGLTFPGSEKIDMRGEVLLGKGDIISAYWAGPLEGDIRPVAVPERMVEGEEVIAHFKEMLTKDICLALSTMASLAQYFHFSNEIMNEIQTAIREISFDNEIQGRIKILGRMKDACLISTSHRNIDLADEIVKKALEATHLIESEEEVFAIFFILLVAGSAFENTADWVAWQSDCFVTFSRKIQKEKFIKTLLRHLRELKVVTPQMYSLISRAEATLLSGI